MSAISVQFSKFSLKKRSSSGHHRNCSSHSLCCFAAEFSIWTREAGAGGLSIAVEGPSKAEITFEDRKDGSCGVIYVVQEPGKSQEIFGLSL